MNIYQFIYTWYIYISSFRTNITRVKFIVISYNYAITIVVLTFTDSDLNRIYHFFWKVESYKSHANYCVIVIRDPNPY